MKKILGCFKIVPNLDLLSEEDFSPDERNRVDVSYIKTELNCFDESGLEMIRRLSDSSDGLLSDYEISALTIAGPKADTYLKTLYALGFHNAVRIRTEEDILFEPERLAAVIATYVTEKDRPDVLVMGERSADACDAKVPCMTAEFLGWPCVTQVLETQSGKEPDTMVVRHKTDRGVAEDEIRFPFVAAVGDVPSTFLRIPTLKDRMKSKKKEIQFFDLKELESSDRFAGRCHDPELLSIVAVDESRDGTIIKDGGAADKARLVYNSYLKGRAGL